MKSGLAAILALIVVLSATAAFASQPVGGVATAEPGKVELSAGYFYSKDKWDSNTLSGEFKFSGNTYYAQLGYGVCPGWDIYLRGGASELKSEGELDVKSGGKAFGGLGFHGKFGEYKPWKLSFGPVGNFTYYENWSDSGSGVATGVPVSGHIKLKDHYSASVGIGLQWKPIPGFTFFMGPFFFYESAKLEFNVSGPNRAISDSDYIKTKTPFGPRFGVNFKLGKAVNMTIEGQYRDYLSGGASIGFNF